MNQLIFISLTESQLRDIIREEGHKVISEIPELSSKQEKNKILNATESADFLGIALPTFYEYTSKNQIPFFKKFKKIYCKQSDLIYWIESGRKKTKAEINKEAEEYLSKKKTGRK